MTDIHTQASQMMHLKNQRLEAVSWYLHRERGCAFVDLSLSPTRTQSFDTRFDVERLLEETISFRESPVFRIWWQQSGEYTWICQQAWLDNPHLSHYNKHQETYGL